MVNHQRSLTDAEAWALAGQMIQRAQGHKQQPVPQVCPQNQTLNFVMRNFELLCLSIAFSVSILGLAITSMH